MEDRSVIGYEPSWSGTQPHALGVLKSLTARSWDQTTGWLLPKLLLLSASSVETFPHSGSSVPVHLQAICLGVGLS